MLEYKIEPGIPLPPESRNRSGARYPFGRMAPGDSFAFPVEETKKIASAASSYSRAHPDYAFAVRTIDTATARIWRLAYGQGDA